MIQLSLVTMVSRALVLPAVAASSGHLVDGQTLRPDTLGESEPGGGTTIWVI